MELTPEMRKRLLGMQRGEIIGHHIYKRIAAFLPQSRNREVINSMAADELGHYETWKMYTHQEIAPGWFPVHLLTIIARLLGFTFAIKLMEGAEDVSQRNYSGILADFPEAASILAQEEQHEEYLLGMLDEERLHYIGSIVLGLNDALVELNGALAGLTLALQNTRLIALAGLITGISAAISMAASEYLSTRSEGSGRRPGRAALYTGVAYIITVALLIAPYLLLQNYFIALAVTLAVAVLIIAGFNFYISVALGDSFCRRFLEMVGLSLGVALFSFGIGYLVRQVLGIKI